jgi:catechol 2,3-dioxygenase-like lactoylglutathione lyase family enzyme
MSLHRLTSVTIGVPNIAETAAYYQAFGLTETAPGRLATTDGGEQLILVESAQRRLVAMGVGVDDPDDLDRVATQLGRLDVPVAEQSLTSLIVDEPVNGFRVTLEVAGRLFPPPAKAPAANGRGRVERPNARAEGVLRTESVRPRKLGHVVIGTVDKDATQRFFTEGLGFKVSDDIGMAAFMRCSTDHHNFLAQQSPVHFLHHTSWEVDDVDEVGRGAMSVLEGHPERHVWGPGRHYVGSNFFWYLRDPAGNFSEYYADMDAILDDQLWKPDVIHDFRGLFSWGPPPSPSFLMPEDVAALMAGAHSAS